MPIGVNSNTSSGDIASTTGTTTISKPTGTANTDVLVVIFGDDQANSTVSTVSAPSGWTVIHTRLAVTSGSANLAISGFWALGNVSNLGFTNSITGGQQGWICVGFTGVDNVTPIDATGNTHDTTGSTSDTAQAVTVVTANAWELIGVIDWNGGASLFSATGFTLKQNAGTNASAGLLYNTTPKGTGSTGTVTVNDSGSATGQVISTMPFALRPAGGSISVDMWYQQQFTIPTPHVTIPY